jgi:hypothetical protein
MPYAYAGDYYRGRAGDYYRGDNYAAGGLLSGIGKLVGGIARTAISATPLGKAISVGATLLGGKTTSASPILMKGGVTPAPEPGIRGTIHRLAPGGSSGYGYYNRKGEFVEGRRPRLNPLNPRALRRAGRRLDGFVHASRKILKHTVYTLTRRGSRGKKKR